MKKSNVLLWWKEKKLLCYSHFIVTIIDKWYIYLLACIDDGHYDLFAVIV